MERRQKILALARAAEATFSTSEWVEVGYLTGADRWIDGHPRLLRSLSWGDPDYKGHVFDAIAHILDIDDANVKRLVEYDPIAAWLKTHEPGQYQALLTEVQGLSVPDVVPTGASEAALAALADAQVLLDTRGPTSAVDRVHTGLHGFSRRFVVTPAFPSTSTRRRTSCSSCCSTSTPGLETSVPGDKRFGD